MIINPYVFQGSLCSTPITNGSSLIANGTNNLFEAPAYGLYDYSWSSFIYTAGLIGAPRQIRGIEVQVSSFTTPYTFNNQTIKLAHLAPATTQFDATPAVDWSDMPVSDVTIVKVFNFTITANGFIQILFDQSRCRKLLRARLDLPNWKRNKAKPTFEFKNFILKKMVDRQALIEELEQYGNVVFCDQNNELCYLVVMSDWTSDEATFEAIANIYIVPDFSILSNITLVNGVLKAQYNSVEFNP